MGSPAEWAAVFGPLLKKLDIDMLDTPLATVVTSLIQLPTLKSITVPDDISLLSHIRRRGNWHHVGVYVTTPDSFPAVQATLAPVPNVSIFCLTNMLSDHCAVHIASALPAHRHHLHLECRATYPHVRNHLVTYRHLICWSNVLTTAHSVNIIGHVPRVVKKKACYARNVSLHGENVFQHGVQMKQNCIGLVQCGTRSKWDAVGAEVEQLKQCTNLEKLGLMVQRGVDCKLAKVMRALPQLRELRLDWALERGKYHTLRCGWLLDVVQQLKLLELLHIGRVVVEFEEVNRVLQEVGEWLVSLEMPVCQQEEGATERLQKLLLAVSRFNPGLEHLHVTEMGMKRVPFGVSVDAWAGVLGAMERAQSRAPGLRLSQLRFFVRCRLDIEEVIQKAGEVAKVVR
eukprot:GFKZ01011145.1.p1 GENE.GFKZ01011145.1~~GFKZ01011145.1.p1  ORF type:complete len:467 (+),score=44.52 GFKZ01011145.1:203-1402(+)